MYQKAIDTLKDKLGKFKDKYKHTKMTPSNTNDISNEFVNIVNDVRFHYGFNHYHITYATSTHFYMTISDEHVWITTEFCCDFGNEGVLVNTILDITIKVNNATRNVRYNM